jgi:hypothetical protein
MMGIVFETLDASLLQTLDVALSLARLSSANVAVTWHLSRCWQAMRSSYRVRE